MRLLALATLAALLLVPAGQACSLFYTEFNQADLDGDKVVTLRGQHGVVIDLGDGTETTVSTDWFPSLMGEQGWIFHKGQEGLGADCSGREYFEVLDADGDVEKSWAAIDDFDVDGNTLAFIRGEKVTLVRLGTWQSTQTFTISRAAEETGPFPSSPPPARIALDAAGERVAISGGDNDVLVHHYGDSPSTTHRLVGFDDHPELDWHDGRLVVASREESGGATIFSIIEDTATGASLSLRLAEETYAWPEHHIGAGDRLLLQRGNTVVEVDGTTTRTLRVPSDLDVGSVAAEGRDAVIMARSSDNDQEEGVGIQRIRDGAIDTYYERNALGIWGPADQPGFVWLTDGPQLAATSVGSVAEQGGESSKGTPSLGVPFALAALLLLRRRA